MQFNQNPEEIVFDGANLVELVEELTSAELSSRTHQSLKPASSNQTTRDSPGRVMTKSTPSKIQDSRSNLPQLSKNYSSSDDGSELTSPDRLRAFLNRQSNESQIDDEKMKLYYGSSFNTFIDNNQIDDLFDTRENFYSPNYNEDYLDQITQSSSQSRRKTIERNYTFSDEPIAFVQENSRNTRTACTFEDIKPFDPAVFDNHENYYSVKYETKSGEKFDIYKQAGNILSYFKK